MFIGTLKSTLTKTFFFLKKDFGKSDITFDEYCSMANDRMNSYFKKNNLVDKQQEFMKFSQEYKDFK